MSIAASPGCEERRRVPGQVEPRQLHAVGDGLASSRRRAGPSAAPAAAPACRAARRRTTSRRACAVSVDVDVAGDDQAGVVGHVVGAEEPRHVFEAGGGEILHRADHRPAVRMARRVEQRRQLDERLAVGLVVDALPLLVLDDVALAVDLARAPCRRAGSPCDPTRETARARARWPARRCSSSCGRCWSSRCCCRRPPRASVSNEPSGTCVDPSNMTCSNRCAKPVRPGSLVGRADVIPEVHRHHRHARVAVQDDVQPVGQRELRVGNGQGRRACASERTAVRGAGDDSTAAASARRRGHAQRVMRPV